MSILSNVVRLLFKKKKRNNQTLWEQCTLISFYRLYIYTIWWSFNNDGLTYVCDCICVYHSAHHTHYTHIRSIINNQNKRDFNVFFPFQQKSADKNMNTKLWFEYKKTHARQIAINCVCVYSVLSPSFTLWVCAYQRVCVSV